MRKTILFVCFAMVFLLSTTRLIYAQQSADHGRDVPMGYGYPYDYPPSPPLGMGYGRHHGPSNYGGDIPALRVKDGFVRGADRKGVHKQDPTIMNSGVIRAVGA